MPEHDPAEAWTRPAKTPDDRQVQFYDRMTEELRRHNLAFRAATGIGQGDRVLDIGCGAGDSTRDAARMAVAGSVLGVDISAPVLERARQLTDQAGLRNVTYLRTDAEVHRFRPEHFDTCISRFGSMFFTDTMAAFTNIGRGLRPGARLVLMVWQDSGRNEWYTAIRRTVAAEPAKEIRFRSPIRPIRRPS